MGSRSDAAAPAPAYDGLGPDALARLTGAVAVVAHDAVGSTMDVAHACAEAGAPAGTLVLADRQTAGRGRAGRRWASEPGAGIWLTLVERPAHADAVGVLSLRLGLAAAPVLDAFAAAPVRLKWPNELWTDGGKLAGVLVEARWQAAALAWIAIGVGVNVVAPAAEASARGLRGGTRRVDVLAALIPALRGAAALHRDLTSAELDAFAARDLARGRTIASPVAGVVDGIAADGALLVRTARGVVAARSGSLPCDAPAAAGGS